MNIEEVYNALESLENGNELVNTVKLKIKSLNDEAKENRIKAENLESELNEKDEQLKSYSDDGKTPDDWKTEIAGLKKQFDALNTKYQESEKKAVAERKKRVQATMSNALLTELQNANCVSPKEISKSIISRVVMNDDETITFDDGKTLSDGVAEYLKENPWAVSNKATPGSGANGKPASKDTSKMTYSEMVEYKKQNPDAFKSSD